jgi:hypothetical protein
LELFFEGTLAMIVRRYGLVGLTIVVSLAWLGCQPAAQPSVQNQKGPPPAQKKGSQKWVRSKSKLDDDSARTRLLTVAMVQEDRALPASLQNL